MKECSMIVLIITTCIELLMLLVLIVYWRAMRESLMTPKQQHVCFKRDKFITAKETGSCPVGIMAKNKNGIILCCGNADDVFHSLESKSVSEKYNADANPETNNLDLTGFKCEATNQDPPTLHLVEVAHNKKPVPVGTSSKLFWTAPVVSDVKSGLGYLANDGAIYLEHPGFYYVSSQIKVIYGNTSNTIDDDDEVFRHYIDLISNKGVGNTLLANVKSRCETVAELPIYTSVVGAVFTLQTGDRLYVAVSNPNLIAHDQRSSYFSIQSIADYVAI